MIFHAQLWHAPCEHPDCDLVICHDRTSTPHGQLVEPGCIGHGRSLCLEHLFSCEDCRSEAKADVRW